MENRDKKLNLPTENPYLGHHGVGARMEISVGKKQWILRETTRSQMFLILSLGLLAFFPLWLLVYKTNEVRGGITSQIILSVVSVFAAIFFYLEIPFIGTHLLKMAFLGKQLIILFYFFLLKKILAALSTKSPSKRMVSLCIYKDAINKTPSLRRSVVKDFNL